MSARLQVAVVRQRYTPYGGAERFIERALPAIESAGAEVTLIARSAGGWGARKVLRVDPFHLGGWWRDVSFARAALRAWRRRGFDLVQSHERIPGCDIYRAGDGVHRRWLEVRRASAPFFERLGIALNPRHRWLCAVEKRMFEHPRLRAVVCNSRMVRDEIVQSFRIDPARLHVIYNGVDLEAFRPQERAARRGAARAALGCSPRDTVFLFVGSGYARKGLDTAIDALALSGSQAFWLVVAGRDRDAAKFVRQAQGLGLGARVKFVGVRDDVRPLYAAADCLLLPTRYDPFPNAALEAMAMGVPAIVSKRCGAAEIVRDGENGWVCAPDDVPGLANRMHEADRALRDPGLGARARASVEPFGLDAMGRQLGALYQSLATPRGS